MTIINKIHWSSWYNNIRGNNWPNCDSEADLNKLPKSIKKELFEKFYYIPDNHSLRVFNTGGFLPTDVYYTLDLDAGGSSFGQEFIDIIKNQYPDRMFNRCYEWCAGCGFIGFSILAHGLCNSLCLSDMHNNSMEMLQKTITINNFNKNKVATYQFEDLVLLPKNEMFDLIVAMPPWYNIPISNNNYNANRIATDLNWNAHKNFFKHIKNHLTTNGIILLQENIVGSTVDDFHMFINDAGLNITNQFISNIAVSSSYLDSLSERAALLGKDSVVNNINSGIYYIEIKHKLFD